MQARIASAIPKSVSPVTPSEHGRGEQRAEGEQEGQRAEEKEDHIQEEPGDKEIDQTSVAHVVGGESGHLMAQVPPIPQLPTGGWGVQHIPLAPLQQDAPTVQSLLAQLAPAGGCPRVAGTTNIGSGGTSRTGCRPEYGVTQPAHGDKIYNGTRLTWTNRQIDG